MAEAHLSNGHNFLLQTLAARDTEDVLRASELIALELKQELYSPDVPIDAVYFPVDGVLSMLAETDEGVFVEVATVGNEGMIGLPVFLGTDVTPGRAFAQVPGQAYRLPATEFKRMVKQPSPLTAVLHRYTQALMVQIGQGTACNRIHTNEQRCARWLLQTQDRVGKEEFSLTQEFLAQMLGVRRATVNEVATQLQSQGMIQYVRGVILVLDRGKLEETACPCYQVIRTEYDRMYRDLRQ